MIENFFNMASGMAAGKNPKEVYCQIDNKDMVTKTVNNPGDGNH